MLISHVPWKFVRSIRWAWKTCSGITTSDADIIWHPYLSFLRPWHFHEKVEDSRITQAHGLPQQCLLHSKWCLGITNFAYYSFSLCLTTYLPQVSRQSTRNDTNNWKFSLGSWAIWLPGATWRRVLRTMHWSQDIHNVRQHSKNAWKTFFLMKEKSSWL